MNNLSYRQGKADDENQILKLIEVVLSEYGLKLEKDGADKDVTNIDAYYINNNGWFQVVENEGTVIGSVGVYKVNNEECELRKMYLYKEYQGKGIGKQLLNNAFSAAKELGFKYMTLQTNSVLKKAIPLYEKYGFKNDDTIEVCSRCDIAMKRELL